MDWMRISNPSKDPILISLIREGLEGIQIKHDKKMAIFFFSIFITQVIYLFFLSNFLFL